MPRISANGIQIYYELHGPQDADLLVLSNGVLMSTASWALQIPALSKKFRLLLYDCRGMWQSEHPPGPYTMELHADDLAALLDELGIAQAHIGGISYGAEIGMVFALKYPEKTRSLVLSSAVSQVDPGMGTLSGAPIGAAILRLLSFYFDKWLGESAGFVLGMVYIALVIFLPYGVIGTWRLRSFQWQRGWQRLLETLTGRKGESSQ